MNDPAGDRAAFHGVMRRLGAAALAWAMVLGWCASAVAQATRPLPASGPASGQLGVRDVRAAMAGAVKFLYSRQDAQGAFPNRHSSEYVGGGEALVALALLTAGEPPEDPRVHLVLNYLRGQNPAHTYTRSLRAMTLALLDGQDSRKLLGEDVRWLLRQQGRNGGWGYGPGSAMTRLRPEWTDASNSQFAVLALREAAEAGVSVPMQTWARAESYWRSFRNRDGGWGYQPRIGNSPPQRPDSHGSMTAAGLATYLIFADVIGPTRERTFEPSGVRKDGRLAFADEIGRAMTWLTGNYAVDHIPKYVWMVQPGQLYYYLFCLLRVGESAGLRTIAGNDYPRQIAELLIRRQRPDGSWNSSVVETAFALLCLAKARAPVVVNRLELGGSAGRDPRDAARLVRWLSRRLRTPLTFQRIGPRAVRALADSRLLYINAPPGARLPPTLDRAFRDFIRSGGTCLVQARPDREKSAESFQRYCLELFPDYRKQEIAADHPVFGVRFKIAESRRPKLLGVGDRCRTRIFILADDVSGAWHQGRSRAYRHLFALGGNIILYAGAGELPPGRLPARAGRGAEPVVRKFLGVARLKYAGDYGVCPLAIPRLSAALARSLPIGLKELGPADPARPIDPAITVLWLTGNDPASFSKAEQANVRRYVETGGTLLIDPAIGRTDFRAAALKLLADIFGPDAVKVLPAGSPLITGGFAGGAGADLGNVRLLRGRDISAGPPRPGAPKLWAVTIRGRIAAILSAYGLTCSVEGAPCYENVGYTTDDARKLALNVILYAATGKK